VPTHPAPAPAPALAIGFAAAADAPAIAALSRDRIEQGLGWSWTAERVARALRDPDTNAIVARIEGAGAGDAPAGFGLMRYGDTDAHLLLLAVGAGFARRGVGRSLVGWLEVCARVAGAERIVLETRATNGEARAFYRRLGFETGEVRPGYYAGREASVRMAKALVG
jgi:ribosomal-protein-alanine N-acetyltransferase